MDQGTFMRRFVIPFSESPPYKYNEGKGFIVWRVGTGHNVEILHLRVFKKRQGYATELIKHMLRAIDPYYSVFVFTLASRTEAIKAYESFGFRFTIIPGFYKTDGAALGTASYEVLRRNLGL